MIISIMPEGKSIPIKLSNIKEISIISIERPNNASGEVEIEITDMKEDPILTEFLQIQHYTVLNNYSKVIFRNYSEVVVKINYELIPKVKLNWT